MRKPLVARSIQTYIAKHRGQISEVERHFYNSVWQFAYRRSGNKIAILKNLLGSAETRDTLGPQRSCVRQVTRPRGCVVRPTASQKETQLRKNKHRLWKTEQLPRGFFAQ